VISKKIVAAGVAGTSLLLANTAVAGDANPTIQVTRHAVPAGHRVTVSGTGWGLDIAQECAQTIKLRLKRQGNSTRITSIRTNGAQSSFRQRVSLPRSLASGKYTLTATQNCEAEDAPEPTIGRAKTRLTIR
jgi:hypothetical protein